VRKINTITPSSLGPLEIRVMEILWARGESTVRDVVDRLDSGLAYTTVMTTLDRLFKKGLLQRCRTERAFSYCARWSRTEWESKRVSDLLASVLTGPRASSGNFLISCLVDAVGRQDEALLDELEKKIRMRRQETEQRGKP
jgi:predicted transcriptional regulator